MMRYNLSVRAGICVCLFFCSLQLSAQTSKTYTLLIGMQTINDSLYKTKYQRSYSKGATSGVPLDIEKMTVIAERNQHIITKLENEQATKANILTTIRDIGTKVKKDDSFIFYFTGHGDVIKDQNGDDQSGYDQVLVTFDDFLVDDEIYACFKKYFLQTKNIMIVDACHSSTTYKIADFLLDFKKSIKGQSVFQQEKSARMQEELLEPCDLDNMVPVNEPFNLVYFGATADESTAIGNSDGGLLTFLMNAVISKAVTNHTWNQYTYRRLACELGSIMQGYQQALQFHEIGPSPNTYSLTIPFKSN